MLIETRDRKKIEAILRRDALWGGYGLADLDDAVFDRTRWFLADDDGSAMALIYEFAGHKTAITFGEAQAAVEIMRGVEIDRPCDIHLPVEHMDVISPLFEGRFEHYVRMGVERPAFRPVILPSDIEIRELDAGDLETVLSIQEQYPDTAFQKDHLGHELYLGAFRDDGMIAMAGTHVSSADYRVAAIGSVVTEPSVRGQGLGTAITSALCCRLFVNVELIVLNVGAENPSAQRVYEKLGFSRPIDYYEGIGVTKL